MNAKNYILNFSDVRDHVLKNFPNESGGIVTTDNMFVPLENLAENPELDCKFDSKVFLKYKNIKALLHSHIMKDKPLIDPRTPSPQDLKTQINTGLECCIVVTDGKEVEEPVWWGDPNHRPDLYERDFIHGIQDCLAFVRDWQYQKRKILMPGFAYAPHWSQNGQDYISENYREWGWQDVPFDRTMQNMIYGDLILFKIQSNVVNHLGVYTGNGKVEHHLTARLPKSEDLLRWIKHGSVDKVIRKVNT